MHLAQAPTDVTLFKSPLHLKPAVMATALYAQDSYSYKRLTVVGGVRWERVEGWIPEQSNPPSPWFPEGTIIPTTIGEQPFDYVVRRSFDEVRNIPLWKNAGPRVSAVYDLFGTGKTALKASVARYYATIGTGTPAGLSPNGTISQRFAWNDLDGDLIFQAGEQGRLLQTTVPPTQETLNLSRDPDLRRPYQNEFTIGVDHELIRNVRASATWIYRREKDQITDVVLNVPFEAYTPVQVTEPGRDGEFGTGDDGVLTVYAENEPFQTHIEQDCNDDRVSETFKGIEVTVHKRFSNNWTLLAGYTWGRQEADLLGVEDPNEALVNAAGRTGGREHIFKLIGFYLPPYGIQVGGNFRLESGRFMTRVVEISD